MSRSVQASFTRLEEIVGSASVVTDAAELAAREVCGVRPAAVVRAGDAAQIAEILRFAATEKLAVIPTSGCSKLSIGSVPSRYDLALDVSGMNRILAYDPHDLTLGVEPGVLIQDLLGALAEQKQFLPLAVPFLERATVGGIVATNSSSPLRHAYGAVRDFCLGMEFVTGEGKQAKSGGRVVKNVTGYDLHKLLIGSLGTLAVVTRVNFRTFPMPQAQETYAASFASAESAFDFCAAISHSVLSPQLVEVANSAAGALVLSGEASARIEPRTWTVIVSAAGSPAVVERHARDLGHLAGAEDAEEFLPLGTDEAQTALTRIREFPRLVMEREPAALIFRMSPAPRSFPGLLAKLQSIASHHGLELVSLARASGILYAAFLPREDRSAAPEPHGGIIAEVFRACDEPGITASAMLEWAPAQAKVSAEAVWGPPKPELELMRRVKHSFDPQNVLSPGRFAGGI